MTRNRDVTAFSLSAISPGWRYFETERSLNAVKQMNSPKTIR